MLDTKGIFDLGFIVVVVEVVGVVVVLVVSATFPPPNVRGFSSTAGLLLTLTKVESEDNFSSG